MKTAQIEFNCLKEIEADIVIAASGYEGRASYFSSIYINPNARKIVFAFNEYKNIESRKRNDDIFRKLNYEFVNVNRSDQELIVKILDKEITEIDKNEINIVVDYSSMTKLWYASILNIRYKLLNKTLNIYFVYCVSKFIEPDKEESFPNQALPIRGFAKLSVPDRPTALLIGLGYEYNRAFGLKEYFDAEQVLLFYATESIDPRYIPLIEKNNEKILLNIPLENRFRYPLLDINYIDRLLSDVIESVLPKYRIVIAPSGPKPFILASLINGIRYKNIDIWSISGGARETPLNKEATGQILIYKVTL